MLRKTKTTDIDEILEIYDSASKSLREMGVPQWQHGYPNKDVLLGDMESDSSYVVELDGKVVATSALIFGPEKDYKDIEGAWNIKGDYATIHRIAIKEDVKHSGIASKMFDELVTMARKEGAMAIRVDTHRDNYKMKGFIEKMGFTYSGVIYVTGKKEVDPTRLAYEYKLDVRGKYEK